MVPSLFHGTCVSSEFTLPFPFTPACLIESLALCMHLCVFVCVPVLDVDVDEDEDVNVQPCVFFCGCRQRTRRQLASAIHLTGDL